MRQRIFSRRNESEDIREEINELRKSLIQEQSKTQELLNVMIELAKNQTVITSSYPRKSSVAKSSKTIVEKKLPELKASFFSDEVENLKTNFESLGKETEGEELDIEKVNKLKRLIKGVKK